MVTKDKPKGITITVRDRKDNRSKSITVYGSDADKVFEEIKKALL